MRRSYLIATLVGGFMIAGLGWFGLKYWHSIDSFVELEGFVLGKKDRVPFRFEDTKESEDPVNRDFSILAPQIGVNAPVFENVDGSKEENYLPNVLRGVAHYKHKELENVTVDGALPGQPGNIFLFGHSQIPGGDLSNYQGVFNNLEELVEGDVIKVFYQGQEYNYEVKSGEVVDKNAVEYLEHTEKETLTLMSCWPLGLDWKRYMVRAERVD